MPLNSDVSTALRLLENIQQSIQACDDPKLEAQAAPDLNLILSLLDNPVFRGICTMQDSLSELNSQLQAHPSILPGDFDLNPIGQLVLNLPPAPSGTLFDGTGFDGRSFEPDDQRVPVAKLSLSSSSGGDVNSPQVASPNMLSLAERIPQAPITTTTYALEFQKAIEASSMGRDVHTVQLYKPEGSSLGFSVVGFRSEDRGELGIYVQEIQTAGIAGRDGRLQEGDQILAIDGQPLDADISHHQAINILQQARGLVELVIARQRGAPPPPPPPRVTPTPGGGGEPTSVNAPSSVPSGAASPPVARSPSATSDTSKAGSDMVLNTEWAQVEVIDLVNDGSGLGFGIIGGRSTGVVVKTILPGGVADRDARLQSGDHILQIGEVNLRGMGSEQVAAVLRQSGSHVRLVVARPVEPTSPDYQALGSHAPIVPTKILGDAEELDRHLLQNGYGKTSLSSPAPLPSGNDLDYDPALYIYGQQDGEIELHPQPGSVVDVVSGQMAEISVGLLGSQTLVAAALPEMDTFDVELRKDAHGLGITIAGYVCEKEELSGIFVKSISEGSAADMCRKIQVNDRIVEVDAQSLQGFNNHQAVEVLRATGKIVRLKLERYLRGPKFEQLQQAIANSEMKAPTPSSPSITSLAHIPISTDGETETGEVEPELESHTTIDSLVLMESGIGIMDGVTIEASNTLVALAGVERLIDQHYEGEISPTTEEALIAKWGQIMGPETEIVVAQLSKQGEGGGLGISLEGTVDVEDGQEVRPHHYIRSILPDGPVGRNDRLRSGDELLEVNGRRLLGLNHVEVVSILKDLPLHVRMVCARKPGEANARLIDTSQDRAAFAARNILGGSLQNLIPASDRLVKAKSDGSLASSATAGTDSSFSRMKSRSLEPLTGLAMWSSEPQVIELVKGDRGLGFSILDYQDPMNPSETVIVIRSLVPGGVAQQDGRLIPGDRLLFVNNMSLENASLDRAVQALKGAPRGVVRIGVAKPLPLPDSAASASSPSQGAERCSEGEDEGGRRRSLEGEGPQTSRGGSRTGSATLDARSLMSSCSGEDQVSLGYEDAPDVTPLSPTSPVPPPLPSGVEEVEDLGVAGDLDDDLEDEEEILFSEGPREESATEQDQEPSSHRLSQLTDPGGDLTPSEELPPLPAAPAPCLPSPPGPSPPPALPEPQPEPDTPDTPLAGCTTLTIKLPKSPSEPLGVAIEAEGGVHQGALVTSVLAGGAAHRDGRILEGAELLSVNHEGLRRVSQAQVRVILRRAALLSTEVTVTFLPPPQIACDVLDSSIAPVPPPSAFAPPSPPSSQRQQQHPLVESQPPASFKPPQVQVPTSLPGIAPRQLASSSQPRVYEKLTSPRSPHLPSPPLAGDSPSPITVSSVSRPLVTPPATPPRVVEQQQSPPPPESKTEPKTESLAPCTETCVTVISVSHGEQQSPPQEPPSSPPPPPPSLPVDPPPSLSRTEIVIGEREDSGLVRTVRVGEPQLDSDSAIISSSLPSSTPPLLISPPVVPQKPSAALLARRTSGGEAMTVTQVPVASGGAGKKNSVSGPSSAAMAKHWGPERLVEVLREPNCSLGISIVGGKVDLYNAGPDSGSAISGIFIKNVLPNSPAGRTGELKTGDRILEVDSINLRSASHERAVEVIRGSGNPVCFLVQSLIQWNVDEAEAGSTSSITKGSLRKRPPPPVPMAVTPLPEVIQPGNVTPEPAADSAQQPLESTTPTSVSGDSTSTGPKEEKKKEVSSDSDDSDDDEDTRDMEGRITTAKGQEIYRASAGAIKRTEEEIKADPEEEDEYGYTTNKVKKKYGSMPGTLVVAVLERGPNGLGVSIAGHRDRSKMAVFVAGLNPNGTAYREGTLKAGDEILEVNGVPLQGRCHLNASAVIKGLAGPVFKMIAVRRDTALQELAVKPITQFPVSVDDETPEERYAKFKGLKIVTIKKGPTGLGIMIIEGKHAEVGQGIFISDLQEGSAAEQAGLCVGEMILQVNKDPILGTSYDTAAKMLKKTEGVVTLVVCNPNLKEPDSASLRASVSGPASVPAEETHHRPTKTTKSVKLSKLTTNPLSLARSPTKPCTLPVASGPAGASSPSSTPSPRLGASSTPLTPATAATSAAGRPKSPVVRAEEPPEPPADPATCPIKTGKETTIEVNKDKMGLGLSIVGGSDTLLSAIIIHEVYPDGAAAKDGRLRPGDQILEVNSEDFRSITHTKALTVLRQTPVKVKMVVLREETAKEEDRYDALDVELVKKPGKGLGLSIVGRKNGTGVFISDVVHGGTAEADGRLMKGDQILSVNGQDLKTASQEEAAAVLKTVAGKVNMKLGRLKAARKGGAANGSDKLEPEEPPLDRLTPPPIPPLPSSLVYSPPPSSTVLACREVRLARGPDGLGFSIVGGHNSPHGDLPIYVKTVFESGAAASSGALRRGDQIVAVDGVSLEGLTHQEAVAVLKHALGPVVTLTIKP